MSELHEEALDSAAPETIMSTSRASKRAAAAGIPGEDESPEGESKRIKTEATKMACNQTAVAVLQELCMKKKWNPPIYDVIDVTGPSNDPMFEVSVTLCNGIKGVGRGRQKKAAKHEAAKKALALLGERALPDVNIQPAQLPNREPINPHEDIGGCNPVGELQTLCSVKHFPAPLYTLIADVGEPHEKTFTFKCTVSERSAQGTARKKQLAKHIAAQNMLQILQSNLKSILDEIPNDPAVSSMYPPKPKEVPVVTEEVKLKDLEVAQKYKLLKSKDDLPSAPVISPGTRFIDYHRAYAAQLTEYKSLKEKPIIKQEINPLKKLQMIAEELHFKITIASTADNGKKFIVFVHLDTDPPTIQAGHDSNENEATAKAAHNVIEFLDIMST
ncbi:hypothetical protein ONE63_001613 [Megalurothrips usitatus]|uniref:DRBM domain-containing protein n=1 Tax=Megalurothrips usitatus TaxID=439358 RepID=A0AAV7XGQ5_9NEOP|nr:hypothetical protein ONE63_001613 [Megalurothrips usitatus]